MNEGLMVLVLEAFIEATGSIGGSTTEGGKTTPVREHRVVACSQRQCKKSSTPLALKAIIIATGSVSGSVAEGVKTIPVRGHRVVACSWRQSKKLSMALASKAIIIVIATNKVKQGLLLFVHEVMSMQKCGCHHQRTHLP